MPKLLKTLIFSMFLIPLASLAQWLGPQYGQHDGYIRVKGYPVGLNEFINFGYPNYVNTLVGPQTQECAAMLGEDEATKAAPPLLRATASDDEKEKIDTTQTITPEDLEASYEAKVELEENLTTADNTFDDVDEFFRSITTEPPPNCRYKLKGFTTAEVRKICRAMDAIAKDQPINEDDLCHVSNCTTASYLAIIKIAKSRSDWDRIKSRFTCTSPFPAAYRMFGGPNGLRAFAAEYGLGESRRLVLSGNADRRSEKLKTDFAAGWPKKSDPILLQRDDSKGRTAHSVIFSHYETASGENFDPSNPQTISKVCYWSSNLGTRGTSNRCEPISYLSFIDAAQIK